MKSLSDNDHYGQQSVPETILPFPGLDAIPPEFPDIIPFDADGEFAGEFDCRPDDPAPAIPVALTIRAPRGPQPVTPGYTAYAVRLDRDADGDEDVAEAQVLTGKFHDADVAMLAGHCHSRDRSQIQIPATHVVVNDHTGRELHRWKLAG